MAPLTGAKSRRQGRGDTLYLRVGGMTCDRCVRTVTSALLSLSGVEEVAIRQDIAEVSGSALPAPGHLVRAVQEAGYQAEERGVSPRRRELLNRHWGELLLIAAALLLAAWGIRRIFGYNVFNAIPAIDDSVTGGMLFVTGLLTGVHCIGMCSAIGILASAERNSVRSLKRPLLYNAGRVLSYTLLGGLVGLLGSVFSLSPGLRGAFLLAAALGMLLMALSMLGLFRLRLPRLSALLPGGGRGGAFVLGLLNGLMPCGPLQAMQLYALSTGSFLGGARAMLLFALGTVPLMLLSGLALSLTRGRVKHSLGRVASVLVLLLSLVMLNRGLLSLGIDVTNLPGRDNDGFLSATLEDGVQTLSFELSFDSYADVLVQRGIPVRMTVYAEEEKITGCNNEIVCPAFGFDVPLSPGENVIEFTPEEAGDYPYTCWMNMIHNTIRVVDELKGADR